MHFNTTLLVIFESIQIHSICIYYYLPYCYYKYNSSNMVNICVIQI